MRIAGQRPPRGVSPENISDREQLWKNGRQRIIDGLQGNSLSLSELRCGVGLELSTKNSLTGSSRGSYKAT